MSTGYRRVTKIRGIPKKRALHSKWKSTVRALQREDGSKCVVDEEMRLLAANLYANLFTSEESSMDVDRIASHRESGFMMT